MRHNNQSLLGRIAFTFILIFIVSKVSAKEGVKFIDPNSSTGGSMAVIVEPTALLHTAQLFPVDAKGKIAGKDNLDQQIDKVLKNISTALSGGKGGKRLDGIVKLNVYAPSPQLADQTRQILSKKFNGKFNPAVTLMVSGLPHPDALVAMDAVAAGEHNGISTQRFYNKSLGGEEQFANMAVLPTNQVVYVAGQADKGTVAEATAGTLNKLKGSLDFLGLTKNDVVQCKAFINSMAEVPASKKEFEKFFAEGGAKVPPLVFVEWISKDYPIEIETIVAAKPAKASAEPIEFLTPPDVKPSPVYAKLVRVNRGNLIYFSGLYGQTTPENDIKEIYGTLGDLLKKTGSDFEHLAKATYYWSDPPSNSRLDAFRPTIYKPKSPPSASKARVKHVGMEGKGITIDMIGVSVK